MYNVGNTLLAPPLPGLLPGAMPGASPLSGNGFASAAGDGISQFAQPPGSGSSLVPWWGMGNGAGGFIAQFMSTIFGALTQMAQYFTSMLGQPPWGSPQTAFAPAQNSPSPTPAAPAPTPGKQPTTGGGWGGGMDEEFFSSATASSNGDPHDAFSGTTQSGQAVGERWNSMLNHPNLLVSDSFDGGFRISTDVAPPNAHGVTHNDAATIETQNGKTSVTMNGDGSYDITDDGKAVQLHVGQTKDLGNGESVTLNADHSLTVVDTNASGGEITTTLTGKNGHVNVQAQAQDVDLGGFLVRHTEKHGGGASGTGGSTGTLPVGGWPAAPGPQPFNQYQPYVPYQPSTSYQQPAATDFAGLDQPAES